jgi:hypothetical protein
MKETGFLIKKAITYLILSFVFTVFSRAEKITLGVMNLSADGIGRSDSQIITHFVEEAIFNLKIYDLVARTKIEDVLKELGFQQSGICGLECAVKVGRQLASDKVVVGSVGKLGSGRTYTIQLQLIDVETGKIDGMKGIYAEAEIDQMLGFINMLVKELFEPDENVNPKKDKTSETTIKANQGNPSVNEFIVERIKVGLFEDKQKRSGYGFLFADRNSIIIEIFGDKIVIPWKDILEIKIKPASWNYGKRLQLVTVEFTYTFSAQDYEILHKTLVQIWKQIGLESHSATC